MKKRLLALALVGTMVFSATACKKNTTQTETTTAATQATTETTTAAFDSTPVKQTTAIVDYSQYITLGQYTGLDIEVDSAVITEEDMVAYRQQIAEYYNMYAAETEQITDRVTALGDTINFDYKGLLDGVAFDGGTATGASITLGSGTFIESLESQLVGLEIGKEYSLNCQFPENYGSADLAGKDVVFVVTVHYINGAAIELEYGDELINNYSGGKYTDVATFEAEFKAEMEADALESQESQFQAYLLNKIIENSEVASYPEEKLAEVTADYIEYYKSLFTYYATMYGVDIDTFLANQYGITWAEVETECASMAEQEVLYIMLSCEIFKALNMSISDDEFNTYVQDAASAASMSSGAEYVETYGEANVREAIIFDKVSEYLLSNNNKVVAE